MLPRACKENWEHLESPMLPNGPEQNIAA